MEALAPATIGIAGLGPWGSNLARNFNELARLAWACDADETKLASAAARYPAAKPTTRFEDLLEPRFLGPDLPTVGQRRASHGGQDARVVDGRRHQLRRAVVKGHRLLHRRTDEEDPDEPPYDGDAVTSPDVAAADE